MSKIFRCGIFLLIFILIYAVINSIFRPKFLDGVRPFLEFYRLRRNSVDVFFFGSSHVFVNIDPFLIWHEKGIPSFILGSSVQTLPCTYYYLVEMAKYQKPKLVIIDLLAAIFSSGSTDELRWIRFNGALRPGVNKYNCVHDTVRDESQRLAQRLNVFLGLPSYHSRFNQIERIDFVEFEFGRYLPLRGRYAQMKKSTPFDYSFESMDGVPDSAFPKIAREYLDKITNFAADKDIPLLFVVMPHKITPEQRASRNIAVEYLKSKGHVVFDDGKIYAESGLDSHKDFADTEHYNRRGTYKASVFFAKIIAEHYKLPDKRKEPEYAAWNEDARYSIKITDWENGAELQSSETSVSSDIMNYPELKRSIVKISAASDSTWRDGINRSDPKKILFDFTWQNYFLLDHAESLIIENEHYFVNKIALLQKKHIIVSLDAPVRTGKKHEVFVELNF